MYVERPLGFTPLRVGKEGGEGKGETGDNRRGEGGQGEGEVKPSLYTSQCGARAWYGRRGEWVIMQGGGCDSRKGRREGKGRGGVGVDGKRGSGCSCIAEGDVVRGGCVKTEGVRVFIFVKEMNKCFRMILLLCIEREGRIMLCLVY